jgi:glycerol-3-phosphate dehydrogenase
MVTITGGKLTTWRRMAKLAVDRIVERDARDAPCRTHEIQIGQAIAAEQLPRVAGVDAAAYPALAARYGHAANTVLAIAAERAELAAPIVGGFPDLLAEVVHAARNEQARTIGDVMLRRTRLALLAARDVSGSGDGDAVGRVADALARELGWDPLRRAAGIENYRAEIAAEGVLVGSGVDGAAVTAAAADAFVVRRVSRHYDGRTA